jgi:tRNA(His) guanylyltransferase
MSDIDDRMKYYESLECSRQFVPLLPIYARIDGRSFHKFTNGLTRPYDVELSQLMIDTTKHLVKETNAKIGYTQSDEISLCWQQEEFKSEVFFNRKIFKITSVLAAMTTSYFTLNGLNLPEIKERIERHCPTFDCRVFQMPNQTEVANMFLWREQDATKNAISMAARACLSHRELQGKSGPEMQEMMFQRQGINFNNYAPSFKRGTFVQRRLYKKPIGDGTVAIRSHIVGLNMPKFATVANREGVIFNSEEPIIKEIPCD